MTGLFHNLFWSCFLISVVTGKVFPPENLRLSWRQSLYPELTWTHPKHWQQQHCFYHIVSVVKENGHERPMEYERTSPNWTENRTSNGGFLNVSVQTVCNNRRSEAVFIGLNDEDLKLNCLIRSSSHVLCSWTTPPSAQLRLFYNVFRGPRSQEVSELQECPRYTEQRRGCELPVKSSFSNQDLSVLPINLLLNGTLGNRTIRNIHHISSLKLNLPPLNWTVTESEEQLVINWTLPAFNNLNWKYAFNIKACDKTTRPVVTAPPYKFNRTNKCSYDISMRGEMGKFGETEWTTEHHIDAASDSNLGLLALILIPVLLAVLVVLTLFCCRKNKDKLWPKVPQPNSELFKDLINNNNKTNFHLPKTEEECEVTLVLEPKQPAL